MSPPNSMMPAEQPGGKPWNAPMMEHDMASFYDSDVVTGDGRPLIQAAGVSQPRQTQPSSESPSKPYHPAESLGQKSQPPELQPGVGLNSGRGAALNSFLCRFVFTLRACGGHSWKADNTSELQDSQQVFDLISNFCDVMHEQVLPHCGSASALEDVDISNVAMLVTTAISLVINAYTSHLDAFIRMGGDKRPSITRAQTTPDFRRSPSMSEPSSRLGSLLQFTVMDFHTSQLRAILDHLNSQESLKSVMKSAGDCMIDIEHLRCRVIETSSNLKAVLQ